MEHSLRQTTSRNDFRSSILARYNAAEEPVQELHLLLGLYCLRRLSRQSPAVYVTMYDAGLLRARWILGKFLLSPTILKSIKTIYFDILDKRNRQPLNSLKLEKPSTAWHFDQKDSRSRCQFADQSLQLCVMS